MKKILKQNIKFTAVLLGFSMLLSSFSLLGMAQSRGINTSSVADNFMATTGSTIKVVQVKAQSIVLPAVETKTLTQATCLNAQSQGLLVQNTAELNLNQPASCFSLNPSLMFETKNVGLSVSEGVQTRFVVEVKTFQEQISPYVFHNAPVGQSVPTIPLLAVLAFVGALVSFRRTVVSGAKITQNFKTTLSLYQLQMLRC